MIADTWAKILAIDLVPVREKFLSRKSWWWRLWHSSEMLETEAEYRQFLYLIATNPGKTIVPWSQKLDDFWHEHILDTRKYEEDCQKIFGQFIHHNPHLPKGTVEHSKAAKETREIYRESFTNTTVFIDAGCSIMPIVFSSCGSNCSSSHDVSTDASSCNSGSCSSSSCSSSSCSASSCGGGCGGGGD